MVALANVSIISVQYPGHRQSTSRDAFIVKHATEMARTRKAAPFRTHAVCHLHNWSAGAVANREVEQDSCSKGSSRTRRALLLSAPLALSLLGMKADSASAASRKVKVSKELEKVFYEAMAANADPAKAEALWTRAIELEPEVRKFPAFTLDAP